MGFFQAWLNWLEARWVSPAYAGALLMGLTLCFFGAALNTMAGWLYVMSGITVALLLIAAVLPPRTLRGIKITRSQMPPVSAGDTLQVELEVLNPTPQAKSLLQIEDELPPRLGQPVTQSIEQIPARGSYRWQYTQLAEQRGIYRWQMLKLRTAAPLGLFWCQRSQTAKATAIVYPTVLPLQQCPLVDQIGQDPHEQVSSSYRSQSATEGITQSLRPYRWGDPIRLIHWRTSARYGDLRVRELERLTGSNELVIALDSAAQWQSDLFEQAVVAAASLYFYSKRQGLQPRIWTAATGLVQSDLSVLMTLAGVTDGELLASDTRWQSQVIWLTADVQTLSALPTNSRWLLWPSAIAGSSHQSRSTSELSGEGLVIQADQPLQIQLQR